MVGEGYSIFCSLCFNTMEFEFDPNKSASNKIKHGIDFIEAQALWQDENAIEFDIKNIKGEERVLIVGRIASKLWTAIVHYREGRIRIISVRRARKLEERYYVEQGH